jgi:hypothetical protein
MPLGENNSEPKPISKSSTISRLLASIKGNSSATWRKEQRERIGKVKEKRMSNGTANFYFPPEEQVWDPRAVQRLARVGRLAGNSG